MILAAALGIQFRIRPMLRAIAEIQVVNAASSALAGAVNRQMAEGTADYGGLISFEKDETGQITAMRTDTGQIARLKAEVFAALDDLVSEVEIRDLGVPLGSLFLPSFFAGRGLRLPVKVVTLNMTNADFYSSFTDCGINQSLQKIWITFSVNITFLTPAGMQDTDVTSDVILAETVIVGSVPFAVPGLPVPLKLGLAGGPLIVAILLGRFGPTMRLVTFTTPSANMMMRETGICLFLASVGLAAGDGFVAAMTDGNGPLYMALGVLITIIPLLIVGVIARRFLHINYHSIVGLMAGATTDPPALAYAGTLSERNSSAVAYSTVYPLAMFLRILMGQLILVILWPFL